MRNIGGLVFDLDGTLADNVPHTLDCFRAAFVVAGHREYTDEELLSTKLGTSQEEIFRTHAPDAWERAFAAFLECYTAGAHATRFRIEGMHRLLDWASSAGLRMGVLTAGGQQTSDITLACLGCRHYFHEILCNPVPAVPKMVRLRALADRWGLPSSTVVYVGDTPGDMRTALDVGLVPLGAAWQQTPPTDLPEAGAVAVFSRPSALRRWLEEHLSPSHSRTEE